MCVGKAPVVSWRGPMMCGEARFDEMYREWFGPVHAYCRRRTSMDRANDAAAETFLTAWRKIDDAPSGSDALPWLYGIARGVVSNTRRGSFRARRLGRKLVSVGLPRADSPDDVIVARHDTSQALIALDALSPGDQEILRLSIWEELSGREVAIALGTSEEAARQRLVRAKRRLTDSFNRLDGRELPGSVALDRDAQ